MPYSRPTLAQLVTQTQNDFISRLSLAGAVLRRSVIYVLSRVLAGLAHMLFGNIAYLAQQIFPDLSDLPYLTRNGTVFGILPKAPVFAQGTASATGTNGSVVPALTQLTDGVNVYTVNTAVTVVAGSVTMQLTATVAGAAGTLVPGVALNFVSPISGVNNPATVQTSTTTGADAEATSAYRARVLARMQNPPQGGASADYQAWTLAAPNGGATRAWVNPGQNGPGSVVVYFACDGNTPTPIPTTAQVNAVQAYLNTVTPVTAAVSAVAPTANPQNFTIHIVPSNTTTQAAVTAQLQDLIARLASPGGTIPLSEVETAIGSAAGVTDFSITTPSGNITNSTGQMTTMGTVTFT